MTANIKIIPFHYVDTLIEILLLSKVMKRTIMKTLKNSQIKGKRGPVFQYFLIKQEIRRIQ